MIGFWHSMQTMSLLLILLAAIALIVWMVKQ